MKNAQRITFGVAAGAGVAALAYGGIATSAFLRYGKRTALPLTTLANYIAEPEVSERHRIFVDAPPDKAFAAAQNVELTDSAVVRVIFNARSLVMGSRETGDALPRPFIEQVKALGWGVLEETPGREIVFGAVCKPWEGDVKFRAVDDFASFAEPGYAKIAWSLSVDALGGTRALVRTETRVVTTGAESRKLFRRYWSFASPGIRLIRREMLRMIKRRAEKSA
jgi:hypothetical protein